MAKRYTWSKRSLDNLTGVHPALRSVCDKALALTDIDFAIIDGLRTVAEQEELVARGRSKTMNSRHLTGHAVDFMPIVNGEGSWNIGYFTPVISAFKRAAEAEGIEVTCGADWPTFKDYGHVQLKWKKYP